MPRGKYVGYSYVGVMPDGSIRYFVSDEEYLEAYEEAEKASRIFFTAPK